MTVRNFRPHDLTLCELNVFALRQVHLVPDCFQLSGSLDVGDDISYFSSSMLPNSKKQANPGPGIR